MQQALTRIPKKAAPFGIQALRDAGMGTTEAAFITIECKQTTFEFHTYFFIEK